MKKPAPYRPTRRRPVIRPARRHPYHRPDTPGPFAILAFSLAFLAALITAVWWLCGIGSALFFSP